MVQEAPSAGGSAAGKNKQKNRQHRNHTKFYQAYASRDAYGVNKARKLYRHLRRHPNCKVAQKALLALTAIARKKARAFFTKPIPEVA